jgi:hypothetical protein
MAPASVMNHADTGEVNVRFAFDPKESQLPYCLSSAMYKLGGGRRGGGKSYTLANLGVSLSLDFPGNRGFIGRRDLADFKDTTLIQLEKAIPRGLLKYHNLQDKEFRIATARSLETGDEQWDSIIKYGELKDPNSILSGEIGWFGIDEAFEVPQLSFSHLGASLRLRLPDGTYPPYFALLMSNPSPGWLMDYFPVLPQEQAYYRLLTAKYGSTWKPVRSPAPQYQNKMLDYDYAYFPFGASDIEDILPPGYLKNITRIYGKEGAAMVARMVMGDWGFQVEGLVYNLLVPHRWNPSKPGQRLYNPAKEVILGIDPSNGAGHYACTVWQVSGKRKHIVDEYKVKGATDDDFIDWLNTQPYANSIAGAVCDSARPDTVKRLQKKGVPVVGVGQKDVTAQISTFKELLRVDEKTGEALLLIDESCCPQLIREFGLRSYKAQKPGGPSVPEQPVKAWDDLLNSAEYVARYYWPVASTDDTFEYPEAVTNRPLYVVRNTIRKR